MVLTNLDKALSPLVKIVQQSCYCIRNIRIYLIDIRRDTQKVHQPLSPPKIKTMNAKPTLCVGFVFTWRMPQACLGGILLVNTNRHSSNVLHSLSWFLNGFYPLGMGEERANPPLRNKAWLSGFRCIYTQFCTQNGQSWVFLYILNAPCAFRGHVAAAQRGGDSRNLIMAITSVIASR